MRLHPTGLLRFATFANSRLQLLYELDRGDDEVRDDRVGEYINRLLEDDQLRDAIALSSMNLLDRLKKQLKSNDTKKQRDAIDTIVKYLARATSRSTPFGLWAATSTLRLGQSRTCLTVATDLDLAMRLDSEVVEQLARSAWTRHGLGDKRIRLRKNPTIYRCESGWRFLASKVSNGGEKSWEIAEVADDEILSFLLSNLDSWMVAADIVSMLAEAISDVEVAEVVGYVCELVESEVLQSELESPVLGSSPSANLMQTLLSYYPDPSLAGIDRLLRHTKVGAVAAVASRVAKEVSTYTGKEFRNILQVDASTATNDSVLNLRALGELQEFLTQIHKLPVDPVQELESYKKRFVRRFDTRSVSLNELFDPDFGLLLGSVIDRTEILPRPRFATADASKGITLNPYECRLVSAAASASESIDLRPIIAQYESLFEGRNGLGYSALVSVFQCEDGSERIWLRGLHGPGAANILSRFALVDGRVSEMCSALAEAEQHANPNCLLAEVVHVPVDRMANIIARPHCRTPYVEIRGRASASSRPIQLDDLAVRMEGDRFILFLKASGREVLPRITSAHNYEHATNVDIYRFLGLLQRAHSPMPNYLWGNAGAVLERFPRLMFGSLVVCPESWALQSTVWRRALEGLNDIDLVRSLRRLRSPLRIPDKVAIGQDDLRIEVDLETKIGARLLREHLPKISRLHVEEIPFGWHRSAVKSANGERLSHEIVLAFAPEARGDFEKATKLEFIHSANAGVPDRRIDERWLYFKVYLPHQRSTALLREVIVPLLQGPQLVKRWHFVRYADPESHLRIRLLPQSEEHYLSLYQATKIALGRAPWVSRIETAGYEPELGRYGGNHGLDVAEQVFDADSYFALAIADKLQESRLLMLVAHAVMDDLSSFMAADLGGHISFCATISNGYQSEFKYGSALRRQLGANLKSLVLLDESYEEEERIALEERQARLRKIVDGEAFKFFQKDNNLKIVESWVGDLIHMLCNRCFSNRQREYELAVYELLRRRLLRKAHRSSAPRLARDV